jgi:hypothetical protein
VNDRRPTQLLLSEKGESFEDSCSLQSSEEMTLHQPQADDTLFLLCHFGGKMRVQVGVVITIIFIILFFFVP